MWQIPVNTPPLALATLAAMIQGQVLPVRTAHVQRLASRLHDPFENMRTGLYAIYQRVALQSDKPQR